MNRIDAKFKELKKQKKKAFVAYICAGDPDIATTKKLAIELVKSGVDILELGIPFSDPLADGPTIQRASQRALKKNVNLPAIFSLVRSLRSSLDIPIVLMGYLNPIYDYGIKRFIKDAKSSGCDGVIIPDLIPEESDEFLKDAKKENLYMIFLAAPTSSKERLNLIAKKSSGFIYYVSLTGVTGARSSLPTHIKDHINQIKKISKKPVCIGFGVSTPKQVKNLSSFSDGVIVGSAIINRIEKNLPDKKKAVKSASAFAKQLKQGLI